MIIFLIYCYLKVSVPQSNAECKWISTKNKSMPAAAFAHRLAAAESIGQKRKCQKLQQQKNVSAVAFSYQNFQNFIFCIVENSYFYTL